MALWPGCRMTLSGRKVRFMPMTRSACAGQADQKSKEIQGGRIMDVTVADLVNRFDNGEIRLPLMQRDYVWPPRKVVNLLDSLYKGWPIGSFYVWQTPSQPLERQRAGGIIPARRMDGLYGFLLDGQQRLTSLSLAIRGAADGELRGRGFFDLENKKFYLGEMTKTITKRILAEDPLLVPLSEIIPSVNGGEAQTIKSIEGIIQRLRENGKLADETEYRVRLDRLSKIFAKKALCEEFPDRNEVDAFELFSRLNKGGTSLSAGDVEAARLASAATNKIVEPMRTVAMEPKIRALGINFLFLLRCFVTIQRENCSFSKLPKHWADDIKKIDEAWRDTETALRGVVSFLSGEIGWTTRSWLPSTMALIPVVYLFAKTGDSEPKGEAADFIRKYLIISGLRSLFRGAGETVANAYIRAISKANWNHESLCFALYNHIPKNQRYKLKGEDLRKAAGLCSPLMQAYLALLNFENARSWPSGRRLAEVFHEGLLEDRLDVHHIFPKKFMQAYDIPIDKLNTAANYAILSQADNAELSDKDPFVVWRELQSNQKEWAKQQLCIGVAKEDLLRSENYEDFVEFRAQAMADQLNAFLKLG